MKTYSKVAIAALAVALSLTPVLAQDAGSQDAPPPPDAVAVPDPVNAPPGARVLIMQRRGQVRGFGGGNRFFYRAVRGRGPEMGAMDMGRFRAGRRLMAMQRLLNDADVRKQAGITDAQAAKIRQQVSDFRKAQIQDRANLEVQRIDLQDLMAAQTPDRSAIDAKLKQIADARMALEKSGVDFRLDMRNAITPEQRTKLRQIMRQRARRMRPPAIRRRESIRRGRRPAPAPNAQGGSQDGTPQ